MVVGIDARMLGPKQGGIGRYVEQLIKSLVSLNCHPERSEGSFMFNDKDSSVASLPQNDKPNFEFVIFLRKENWDLVDESPRIKKALADIPWYGWREQMLLSKIIKKEKVDLMHFPHWNIPLFYNRPFVVTIHDLLLLHYPTREASTLGPITYFFKNLAYRAVLKHAVIKSKHIIAPSEFTKQDIIKNFKILPEKITVTRLGIPNFQFPISNPLRRPTSEASQFPISNFQTILKNYGIEKPYILYVGVAYPHKNLDGLLRAWDIFCAEHGNNYQLVLAGRKNFFYERLEKSIDNGLSTIDHRPSTIFTGFVPDEELPELYKNASLYVFPSFYEGFGLPPLEAMQYGVPVISSNAACLPEILGNAARYFDPRDHKAISETIWQGLNDEALRRTLKLNAERLIHNYSWDISAKATLAVYRGVI